MQTPVRRNNRNTSLHDEASDCGLVSPKLLKRNASVDLPVQKGGNSAVIPSPSLSLKDTSVEVPDKTPHEQSQCLEELNTELRTRSALWPLDSDTKAWLLQLHQWDIPRTLQAMELLVKSKNDVWGCARTRLKLPTIAKTGRLQILPTRDLAGRAVLCLAFDADWYKEHSNEVRDGCDACDAILLLYIR